MSMRVTVNAFDRFVVGVMVAIIGAIGLTVALGDRVGLTLRSVNAQDGLHTTESLALVFSDRLNPRTLNAIQLDPPIEGEWELLGTLARFKPSLYWQVNQTYTLTINQALQSRNGRELLRPLTYTFAVQMPQVAYLYPADSVPQNIWVTPIDGTGEPKQVTFSTTGIFDFAVSPSGRQLVYSQRRSDEPITDLMLLDLGSGESSLLVDCSGADCTAPAWRADELMLAYTRADTSRLLQGQGVSPDRVWLLDLTTTPPNTSPLFEESQILGYAPQWSMNGSRIAMFDNNTPGIVVYDFLTETMDVIATEQGSIGALSPDGSQLVYPQLVFDGARALSVLTLADLETNEVQRLSPNDTPVEDDMPQWSLDGQTLIFSRRYWDERYTFGTQLYGMDADQLGEAYPILVDEAYTHGFFSLDPSAQRVVIQRFPVATATSDNPAAMRPGVWVYDRTTQQATELATNAFYPRWVP